MTARTAKMVVYEARDGWRWQLLSANGALVASSDEAYATKSSAVRGARAVLHAAFTADIYDTDGRFHRRTT